MGLRITTWNVNGIRNPFGYQPWRDKRTFEGMFEILEADIVVMQECKIQRKDLRDDMVLVPGWDVYFSLPKHKKGYSGVAIYTRNGTCAPIRAEEGITGILTPPNSSTSFSDLPDDQQIGGYPSITQLSGSELDAATLDSEGRCVILEFPAFVLIGTYCPATRDETRDEFRIGFLNALDARVRNLVAMGKRVFLTGDLNISREEIDSAKVDESIRKEGITIEDYLSTPSRRLFNQLLVGGKVIGERDEGREKPVMWDICRSFHPTRKGMFTCWETKTNARPGNFGARIDYVLCSEDWKDWFCDSNIQEGLLGSDHCPVFATIKDKFEIDGQEVYIRDIMNPAGMFKDGKRLREWTPKDLLPLSGKLIPEFDRRRNIRDMFAKRPSLPKGESSKAAKSELDLAITTSGTTPPSVADTFEEEEELSSSLLQRYQNPSTQPATSPAQSPTTKRGAESPIAARSLKRSRSAGLKKTAISKSQPPVGQSTLKGFFKPKVLDSATATEELKIPTNGSQPFADTKGVSTSLLSSACQENSSKKEMESEKYRSKNTSSSSSSKPFNPDDQETVIDPIVAKESWGKLLSKRVVPRCEHGEPCVSFLTKKPGINCGRSFYMCPRPLGPSGAKEKNTQWRCGTFIWSSDWTGEGG